MKNSKSIFSNIVWAILILLMLSTVFSFVLGPGKEVARLSISELAAKVNSGEVAKIVVNGEDLSVTLKDGSEAAARKENGLGLTETLNNLGVDQKVLQAVAVEVREESGWRFWAGLLIPTLLPLVIIGVMFWFIFRQAKSGASQAFTFGRSNIRLFGTSRDRVTFKDVAGLKEAKQELEEVVDFLKNPKKYLEIGARIPRGVLLMGLPGTGKTLLARAVAGEAGVPFFHISASEFVEMFVGVGASRTRDAFNTAKKAAPSIIFIDEIDAVGRERGAGLGGGHDEREQTLNQILVEMDGFNKDTQVIVLAATNRPDILDTALLRPGRFYMRVLLDLPDIKEREDILKIHSLNKPLDESVNLKQIATRTPGFSGADLANLINEAAILAVQKGKKKVAQEHIYDSIEKVILGPARKSRLVSDKEREITAYHEAGHALVAAGLKDSDPVHNVSIVSRGQTGGYTLKLPTEDRRLKTKSQFLADLAVVMGGYVAEQETFKEISTGASNDLQEATRLAKLMVTRYGMSEKLGPGTFGRDDDFVFLGREIGHAKDYSEAVAAKIDEEISGFLKRGLEKAQKIISSHKVILKKIADTLIQKEVLEQEEFEKLIGGFKLKPVAF